MYVSASYACNDCRGQKSTLDPLKLVLDGCELSCGSWEPSPGSLKLPVLLTIELVLLPKF